MSDTVALVLCRLGEERYLLDMARVRSIVRSDRLRRQPGPHAQVGCLLDRGGEIPVHDLAQLLDLPAQRRSGSRYAVVIDDQPSFAFLVDQVSQVLRLPRAALRPVPPLIQKTATAVEAVVAVDQEILLLLSICRPGSSPVKRVRANEPGRFVPLSFQPGRQPQLVLIRTYCPQPNQRPISVGLSVQQVLELQSWTAPLKVPGAPSYIMGLTLWREQALAVVDLNARLGLPPHTPDEQTRLLIGLPAANADPLAIPVQPPTRILRLPLPHLPCRRDLRLEQAYVRQTVELLNETALIPDLPSLTETGD